MEKNKDFESIYFEIPYWLNEVDEIKAVVSAKEKENNIEVPDNSAVIRLHSPDRLKTRCRILWPAPRISEEYLEFLGGATLTTLGEIRNS